MTRLVVALMVLWLLSAPIRAWGGGGSDPVAGAPDKQVEEGTGLAGQPPVVRLTDLVTELLAGNPDLRAARTSYQAALTVPERAAALEDPFISMGWSSSGSPLPGAGLGSEPMSNIGFMLSQRLPFPGKRDLRRGVARKEAESESQGYRVLQLRLVSALKQAYYQLLFVYEARNVLVRNRSLLQGLARVSEARYSVGSASQQDLFRSQVELSILESRLVLLEQQKSSLETEINALLNRRVDSLLARPEEIPELPPLEPLPQLQAKALAHSPSLRMRRAVIDGRYLGVEQVRRDYYPDFEVSGGYFNQGSMPDFWEFKVGMNIPLYFGSKQGPALEESVLRLNQARQAYRAEEQAILAGVRDRFLVAEAASKLMDLYKTMVVPQSALALESSLPSYETGSVDFSAVLANFLTVLNYELNLQEQRAVYLKTFAMLEEICGTASWREDPRAKSPAAGERGGLESVELGLSAP